jgi:hypothetical protein
LIQYIELFTIFTKPFSLRNSCFSVLLCWACAVAFGDPCALSFVVHSRGSFLLGLVRLTRYWCCRVPRFSLLVCAVRVVCCFVFRPGHELCRVMSALLRALQCCVLRPVVLPVALVGGVTYCPAVSLLRSAVCELVALCGVSSCPVPCSDLCALLCDFVPARFLRGVCVHAPWHVRGSVRCARVPPWL